MSIEQATWPRVAKRLRASWHAELRSWCWVWTGYVNANGYGGIGAKWATSEDVHRITWMTFYGPIPAGYDVHHHCEVKRCCNPKHLRLLTHGEHSRIHRLGKPPPTHCPSGHPYSGENVYLDRKGCQVCRICRRSIVKKSFYKRKREKLQRS